MKLSTLHKLAATVSKITRTGSRLTVNEMSKSLVRVTSGCRSKRDASRIIAIKIFGVPEDSDATLGAIRDSI